MSERLSADDERRLLQGRPKHKREGDKEILESELSSSGHLSNQALKRIKRKRRGLGSALEGHFTEPEEPEDKEDEAEE